jgi:hypothetical protein
MSELIDVLLDETELHDDLALRELLGELEREATAVTPIPSAQLSQLMTTRRVSSAASARRVSFVRRGAIIGGIAVAGVLGLGAGTAAATPEGRSMIGAGVAAIAHLFQPATAVKAPAPPDELTFSSRSSGSAEPSTSTTTAPAVDASMADHSSSGQGEAPQDASDAKNAASAPSGHPGDTQSADARGNVPSDPSGQAGSAGQVSGVPAPTR